MRERRPFVICGKDHITKETIYLANSPKIEDIALATTASQEDALKFDAADEAEATLKKIGKAAKGLSVRRI